MNLPQHTMRVFVVLVLITNQDEISSSPLIEDQGSSVVCEDIAEAIVYIHENSPDQMTLEDKCIRYAVMASMIKPKGRLHDKAVILVLKMPEDQLLGLYRELDDNQIGGHFMTAIDGFRAASMLGPPFLELIECIKKINTPSVKVYLDGEELNMILRLYRQVLKDPDTKISFNDIDIRGFHRAFIISLMHLFKDHIQSDSEIYHNLKDRIGDEASSSGRKQRIIPKGPITDSERWEMRREERRGLASHRHREQERLRKQRLKILDSDSEREKARLRKLKRSTLLLQRHQDIQSASRPISILPKPPIASDLAAVQQDHEQRPDSQQLSSERPLSHVAPAHESIDRPTIAPFAQERRRVDQVPAVEEMSVPPGFEPTIPEAPFSDQPQECVPRIRRSRRRQQQREQREQQRKQAQQQEYLDYGIEQHLPDLAQLWSQVAPIYESIPTPIVQSPQQQEEQVRGINDFSTISNSESPVSDSHQHEHGRRRRQRRRRHNRPQEQEQRPLVYQEETPPELAITMPDMRQPINDLPVTVPTEQIPTRPVRPPRPSKPPQPLVNPMTPFPHFPNQLDTTKEIFSRSPSPGFGTHGADYFIDSSATAEQSQFDYVMHINEPDYRFEDTDEVVRSILSPSPSLSKADRIEPPDT